MICSKCKESIGLLQSVETQTFETDWSGELKSDDFDAGIQAESEKDCGAEERSFKSDIVRLEDIELIQPNQSNIPHSNAGVLECAAYRDVSDEAFEMDPDMELGTFAEMCHENDKIVALTRSFECPSSSAKNRWLMAANTGKAANRFSRLRKGKSFGVKQVDDTVAESEIHSGLGGFRRIVISSGSLAISRRDSGTLVNECWMNGTTEGVYAGFDGHLQLENIRTGEEAEEIVSHGSKLEEKAVAANELNMRARVSQVLGPNKRCLQIDEQQEQIDPEQYIDLPDTDKTMYNVVVMTRSFECGALSDAEKPAGGRWNRVRNATKFSKALSRLRPSSNDGKGDHDQMLSEDAENTFGPFIGSGYRRMSMKTIEEVASFAKKRKRFWRSHR